MLSCIALLSVPSTRLKAGAVAPASAPPPSCAPPAPPPPPLPKAASPLAKAIPEVATPIPAESFVLAISLIVKGKSANFAGFGNEPIKAGIAANAAFLCAMLLAALITVSAILTALSAIKAVACSALFSPARDDNIPIPALVWFIVASSMSCFACSTAFFSASS